jgi:hypothetical protein
LLRTCVAIAAYVRCNCCAIVISPFSHRRKPLFTSSLGENHAAISIFQSFNSYFFALLGRSDGCSKAKKRCKMHILTISFVPLY